jgi:hypothetical protein
MYMNETGVVGKAGLGRSRNHPADRADDLTEPFGGSVEEPRAIL